MELHEKIEEVSQAAQLGDATRLQEILDNQPTLVNTENTDGLTPLGYAAHYGHIETVKVLLEYGASLDIKNRDGKTAHVIAVEQGNLQVAELLGQI